MYRQLPQLPEDYMNYEVFTDCYLNTGKLKDVKPDITEVQARILLRDGLLFKPTEDFDILNCRNEIFRILKTRKKHFSGHGDLYPDQVDDFVQHTFEDNLILLNLEDVTQDLYIKYICDKSPSPQVQAIFDEMKERLEDLELMIMKATKKRITRLWKTAEKQRV